MNYSQATADLIDRMCRNVERKDFVFNKSKAEECLLKTYDLFGLKRPQKIVWFKDILTKEWIEICNKAWSAGSAWLAGSAWSAGSARLAGSAGSARSARSAWSAGLAGSAGSARSAWSAWSAGLAGSAGSALDYDFDWYIFEFEYCQNPDKNNPPKKEDKIYLDYCELLMQAKEYGMGYRVEQEDTLYCVPTPLVLIDNQNRFHSLDKPAIRWKEAGEFYFIHGVNFPKDLWQKVVNRELFAHEILKLENIEQRYIALKLYGAEKLLNELKAELINKTGRNELYSLKALIKDRELKMLKYICPSTNRIYVKFVPDKFTNADEAQAWSFKLTLCEYENLKWEA